MANGADVQATAKRYARIKLGLSLAEFALSVLVLALFYFSGGSRLLATFARSHSCCEWGVVAVYVAALMTGATLLSLPIGFWGGFKLEHRFNLSNQTLRSWWLDELKSFVLTLLFLIVIAEAMYALLRVTGSWWWAWTSLFLIGFTLLLSFLLPVVIIPIFYKLTKLEDELATKLRAMAEQVGARVLGVYRIDLGEKTKKANAAFAGIGRTRRILLGDTLLAHFSPAEIEVVLAHELAHFRNCDIWKGLAFSSVITTVGLWLSDCWLRVVVGNELAQIQHLPLLALGLMLFSLGTSPLTRSLSRRAEYRADWFALDMTRDPDSFESAMRKLAGQNLADLEPHPVVEFLFHDHPALSKRIAKARSWRVQAGMSGTGSAGTEQKEQ